MSTSDPAPDATTSSGEVQPRRTPPWMSRFSGQLGSCRSPIEVCELVVQLCLEDLGARRAIYLGVDEESGTLLQRFTIGYPGSMERLRAPLASDHLPLVRAALAGDVVTRDLDSVQRLLADGSSIDPGELEAIVVPLVSPPLASRAWEEAGPLCPLGERPGEVPCYLRRGVDEHPDVPPWELRVETLCPGCAALGVRGVVFAERARPFGRGEIEHLGLVGCLAGQRARSLEIVGELDGAVEKLERERRWLDTVMGSAADPIVVTDASHELVLQNDRAEELLISSPDDAPGRRRAVRINDMVFSAYLSSHRLEPEEAPADLPLVHPEDGSDLLFEPITTGAVDRGGRRIGYVTVLRDVTDLHQATTELQEQVRKARAAEDAVRRERDRLRLVVQNALDPIVVTDRDNQLVLLNEPAEQYFQEADEVDEGARQAVVTNDATFSSHLTDFMAGSDPRRIRELRLVHPEEGEPRTFEVSSAKALDERGSPLAVVSVFHDLSRLRETERGRPEEE